MLGATDIEPCARLRPPARLAADLALAIEGAQTMQVRGRVKEVVGTLVRATAPHARIGEMCLLQTPGDGAALQAEVVGFTSGDVLLAPLGEIHGVSSSTLVTPTGAGQHVAVGPQLLGRVLDGFGRPMDNRPAPVPEAFYPVHAEAPNPITRQMIQKPLHLGVRALDGLLMCGEGQRVGIFAAAGCGKSTLMGMLTRNAEVDVTVVALIGERGREVREMLERELGPQGLKRAVVVCSTSDRPPMERLKAAFVATAIAEYFRDQGLRVLLLMDSLTRMARAQREIGLAAGEPPTRRGFPPSVFSMLPRLLERSGTNDKGSITAFYTVLVEGDDMSEPIADETRSILDGHVVLSRKLAAAGQYPAVDILESVSRVMGGIASPTQLEHAHAVRALMSKYVEVEFLLRVGEYHAGADALADKAIERIEAIRAFLRQRPDERASPQDTARMLERLAR